MYHRGVVVCVVLVMLTGLPDRGQGEMFTALIHMEGLLGLERELLSGLNSYIVAEGRRYRDYILSDLSLHDAQPNSTVQTVIERG